MTTFNVGLAAGAAMAGFLRPFFEWQMLFFVPALLLSISGIILKFIKINKHREQEEILEKNYLDLLKEEGKMLVNQEI